MKFTEEQFNKLVELQEKEYPNNVYSSSKSGYNNIDEALKKYDLELYRFVEDNDLENQVVALMNPATRELAHDQFVEKEKKFVWRLKTDNNMVISTLFDGWFVDGAPAGKQYFTETEIENSPFKPEWFNKEKVK